MSLVKFYHVEFYKLSLLSKLNMDQRYYSYKEMAFNVSFRPLLVVVVILATFAFLIKWWRQQIDERKFEDEDDELIIVKASEIAWRKFEKKERERLKIEEK